MAFISESEKERAQEFIRRYGIPMPLDDLLMYVSSVYAEGRADERKECLKCVNEVQLNALKAQRLEVGKSQSGMDFQSGRRKGAEDAIALIAARSALQITQDKLSNSYPEADEAAQVVEAEIEVAPVPEPVPASNDIVPEIEEMGFDDDDDIEFDPESEAEIIDDMQIDVPDVADDDEGDGIEEADEPHFIDEVPDDEPETVIRKRPIKKRSAVKKAKPKAKPRRR